MAYQRRDNKFGGRSKGAGFRDKGFSKSGMHKATCSECGKSCTVPFKPTGSKPIFCSNCFEKQGKSDFSKNNRDNSSRYKFDDKRLFDAICDKCQKSCQVPFKPTGDKNVYCSKCFSKGDKDHKQEESTKQLEIINSKLDKILKMLSVADLEKTEVQKPLKKEKKVVKKKVAVKKKKKK